MIINSRLRCINPLNAFRGVQLTIDHSHPWHRLCVPNEFVDIFHVDMTVICADEPWIKIFLDQVCYFDAFHDCAGLGCLKTQHNLFGKLKYRLVYSDVYIFWDLFFIKFLILVRFHIHCEVRQSSHEMRFDLRG
jgi:hypothetical protein